MSESLIAGIGVKYANSNIAQVKSAHAVACDLGVLYLPPIKGIMIFFAAQNLGFTTKFIERAEELPTSMWFGTSYSRRISKNIYFSAGIDFPYILKETRVLPAIGVEFSVGIFLLNLGYRFGVKEAIFHIGFGVSLKNIDFGYAFIPAAYLSHTHRFNIGFRF